MGVYIKGMEMPTSWRDCPFSNGAAQCKLINMEICDKQHAHRSICPLVHVPKHGRLADLDKIENEIAQLSPEGYTTGGIRLILDSAPTIIPAEEGE